MNKIGLGKYVEDGLTIFGKEVNTNRQLASFNDGLKPIYRRLIYASLQYPDKMIKVATLAGFTVGNWHPHGTASVEPVISNLVRWGIFEGQGNHGLKSIYGEDTPPSAGRYIEAKISPKFRSIFADLMPYVPMVDGELDNQEPAYLPSPVPLTLLFSNLGIGFGVNMRVPAFTIKSIYNALIKDDPNELEAPFGLILDKEHSDLKDLWTTGLGKVTYKYKVEYVDTEAGRGALISGEAEIFKPNLSWFEQQRDWGRVFITDLTDETSKLLIGRNYNVKAVSIDEILAEAEKAATYTKTYRLTTSDGEQVFLTPMREWVRNTYENYVRVVQAYISDQLAKYQFNYKVYEKLPEVAEYLFNNRSADAQEISTKLGIELDVVNAILNKSIRTLRNTDSTQKLPGLQEKIDYFNKVKPEEIVLEKINEF